MAGQSVLLAAGSNSGGQLGLDHDQDAHTLQQCQCDLGSFPPPGCHVQQLASGSNHAVALVTAGDSVQLWGSGSGKEGQLGTNIEATTKYKRLDLDEEVASLLGVKEEDVQQWRPIRVACGWNSTFIVYQAQDDEIDDFVIVLGKDNDFGQLGLGEAKRVEKGIGLVPLSLLYRSEERQRISKIIDIACGLRHTVILVQESDKTGGHNLQLFGWGAARQGQLDCDGQEKLPSAYWTPHKIDSWETRSESIRDQCFLAAGKEHTVYCGPNQSFRSVGSNRRGQRVVGGALSGKVVLSAACTWNATLVQVEGSILGSGDSSKGQLGGTVELSGGVLQAQLASVVGVQSKEKDKRSVESLVCGSEHVLVLARGAGAKGGQVWGWGWNEHGNLAQGDEIDRKEAVLLWPSQGSNQLATHVWAGCGTSFIQVENIE